MFSVQGAICLDTLGSGWSPVGTIKMALISLRMLLESPNPKDPQDAEVAKMMMENPKAFAEKAHDWAIKHAGAPKTEVSLGNYEKELAAEAKKDDPSRYESFTGPMPSSAFPPPSPSSWLLTWLSRNLGIKGTIRNSSTGLSTWASTSMPLSMPSTSLALIGMVERTTSWKKHTWVISLLDFSASSSKALWIPEL